MDLAGYMYIHTHIYLCIKIYTYIYASNNNNKRKRGYQLKNGGHMRTLRECSWEGIEGGKEGRNHVILFHLKH